MNQVDRVRVITEKRENPMCRRGDGAALPEPEEKKQCRYGINHAAGTELMDCEYGGQRIVAENGHDAAVGCQHRCRGDQLEGDDELAVPAEPSRYDFEMLCRIGAEHEDEEIVKNHVIQTISKGVL